ncbi:MAG TPA: DUF1905 domain-containing protein [Microlunatus sp.]
MAEQSLTVTGTIEATGGGGHAVRLPVDVKTIFGRARPPVRVVADGRLAFPTTVASYGGVGWIGLRKDQLAELGLVAGDQVTLVITEDLARRKR